MAQATRTFRIFVSSTFSDLRAERNALQKDVFPKLRELCMQHGCRFQSASIAGALHIRARVLTSAATASRTRTVLL